jgi:hypothetical protein
MAHPEGPSDSNRGEGGGAGAKELSPEDFDRLASIFRPSWKLDDAPFTTGASFSKDELQALQGAASPNGIHGTPIVVVEDAPITAASQARSAPSVPLDTVPARARAIPGSSTIIAMPPAPDAQPTVPSLQSEVGAVALPGSRTTTSSWPPRAPEAAATPPAPDAAAVPPAQRPTVPSWTAEGVPASQRPNVPSWTDDDRSPFSPPAMIPAGPWASAKSAAAQTEILRRGPRSRTPMWMAIGAAVVVTGIGLAILTRSSAPPTPPPPAPEEARTVAQAPVAPIPAPTASTALSTSAAPAASEPPPKQEEAPPAAASAPPPVPVVEAAPQQATPAPALPMPKPAPAAKPAPEPAAALPVASPAPKPPPRPKPATQTIVHDVPF